MRALVLPSSGGKKVPAYPQARQLPGTCSFQEEGPGFEVYSPSCLFKENNSNERLAQNPRQISSCSPHPPESGGRGEVGGSSGSRRNFLSPKNYFFKKATVLPIWK